MARDSLVREAVRKTAVGRFDSGPCLFGAHAVHGRGRLAPGRVEARRLSPTFNGVVRVRIPSATIRCAPPHSPAFLSSPAAVTALAVRARVEDRRLPVLKNRNPPAVAASSVPAPEARPGRVEDGRLSRDRKASRFESCSLPLRRSGAAQRQSVRGELRLPDPTSARAAPLQPHHIRPEGRAEPKMR